MDSINYTIFVTAYKTHFAKQEAHRNIYYSTRYMSISKPEKCLTIIYDKMDHATMASPCFANKSKNTDAFIQLPIAVMDMIAHGSGDVKFAHFPLDLYPSDSNHIVGFVAKLLCNLEKPSTSLSGVLFENSGSTILN